MSVIGNQFKTVLLLGILTGILIGVGGFLGGRTGLLIGLVFAVVMNFGSYWFSDKIVLAMYRAKEVSKKDYPELHKIVEEVSKDAEIPKPKVFVVPSEISNAFATGRNPKNSVVAVTNGIMNLLSNEELKGVIAHEISHIKNRDILISTIAATIAGVISYVAMMARWGAMFGGRDRNSGNIIVLLLVSILAPIAAIIVQLAISRSREFIADASGAKLLKNGKPLASALRKLEGSAKVNPMKRGNPATAHMFIVNPFVGRSLINLFTTHPSTEIRAAKLETMKF